jgi:hypothetical protein
LTNDTPFTGIPEFQQTFIMLHWETINKNDDCIHISLVQYLINTNAMYTSKAQYKEYSTQLHSIVSYCTMHSLKICFGK